MINTLIFKHVLHVGPNYRNHKGGMGAVIAVYQKNVKDFNFIPSYEGNYNSILNIPFFFVSFFRILWLLIINSEIKIIHMHGASYGSFYRKYIIFLLGKYLFQKKIVYHLHAAEFHIFYEESNSISKRMIAHLFDNSECIIVLSKQWLNYVTENFKPRRIIILNNPIEIPANLSSRHLNNDDVVSFLFMGRIGQRKGIFDLLDVIVKNRHYYSSQLFLKIGGDGEVEKLKSFIKNNHLADIVDYIGWVDGNLKHNSLSTCDVLILPSYNEGLPIAILEAMSYGKAIISTNVGGIPEVVHSGINGFLVEPGDKEAIQNSINIVLSDKAFLQRMGKNSLETVRNYDISEVLKIMESLYICLLK